MKRRSFIKNVPLALSSLAGIQAMAKRNSSGAAAEVRLHHGTPTLFLNGEPVFAGIYWVSAPTPTGWEFSSGARQSRQTGIHIYAFDVGVGTEWRGPAPGRSSDYDFSTLQARFQQVLRADPLARFHLRCHLEIGHDDGWEKEYPQECEVTSEGKRNGQSFASSLWRSQAHDFLRAYIRQLQRLKLAGRVVAIQVGAGHTGEWVKGETSMHAPCGDFSEPMRHRFRAWLRQRYGSDAGLRAAWKRDDADLETAEVPTAAEQLQSRLYTFRDPRLEQHVIDYFRCLAELCGDLVADFCRTVKEASNGRMLAGAFFGYLLDLAWNGGFFRERPDSDYSTYQRSGHLGLRRVLQSPHVDFLVSPYSYGFRGLGGDAPSMLPSESVRRHGKLLLIEDDSRTHIDAQDPHYGHVETLAQSQAILKRNFCQVLCHGQGVWWATWKVDTVKEPAFIPLLARFQKVGRFALNLERGPAADIAVFVDDESFFYQTAKNNLDLPLIFQQRFWGLPHCGAPFDLYLLEDLLAGELKPYKLYIFLNPFRLDRERRAALQKEIRRQGRVALWIYAPGFIRDEPGLAHMEELTGIRLAMGEQPWGPLMHVTDFTHPLTRGLPQDLAWGTNSKLAPIFYVADPQARILGEVVFSQGDCKPGLAVKEFGDWTSVYCSAPNLPAPLLRNLARLAGAHLFSEAGDLLYATPQLLAVHTVAGGPRSFRLNRPVEAVCDLFTDRLLAENVSEFKVELAPFSSVLYYTGEAALLRLLAAPA